MAVTGYFVQSMHLAKSICVCLIYSAQHDEKVGKWEFLYMLAER